MEKKIDHVEIKKKVNEVISNTLVNISANEITADDKLVEDFGADSLDIYELIINLETEFDISIPDDSIILIQKGNAGLVYDIVAKCLSGE